MRVLLSVTLALVLTTLRAPFVQAQSGSITLPSSSISSLWRVTGPRYYVIYRNDGKVLMEVDLERGTMAFGPGLPENEAAKETWRALARQSPAFQQALGEAKDESCWRTLFGLR